MRTGLTAAEREAIDRAIAGGMVTVIDRPPPMDPDEVARRYARKPVSRRPFKNTPVPQDILDEIRSMDGLYSRQEIADRMEVGLETVRRVLGATTRKGGIKVPPETREGVIAMRGSATIPAIAEQFGIGQATVSRLFKEAGLVRSQKPRVQKEPRPRSPTGRRTGDYRRKVTPEIRQKIIELHGQRMLKDIGSELGPSQPTISKVLIEAGLRTGERTRAVRPNEIFPDELAQILALRGVMSAAAIAKRFGRHPTSIRKLFGRVDRRRAEAVQNVRSRTPRGCPPEAAD